jgi:hypothetical protein
MKRIDSPRDVAITQYEAEPEDTTLEIILKIARAVSPKLALVAALRDHFSAKTRHERIRQVFLAFNSSFESIEKESAQNKENPRNRRETTVPHIYGGLPRCGRGGCENWRLKQARQARFHTGKRFRPRYYRAGRRSPKFYSRRVPTVRVRH